MRSGSISSAAYETHSAAADKPCDAIGADHAARCEFFHFAIHSFAEQAHYTRNPPSTGGYFRNAATPVMTI